MPAVGLRLPGAHCRALLSRRQLSESPAQLQIDRKGQRILHSQAPSRQQLCIWPTGSIPKLGMRLAADSCAEQLQISRHGRSQEDERHEL